MAVMAVVMLTAANGILRKINAKGKGHDGEQKQETSTKEELRCIIWTYLPQTARA
jgi:hypothetical protein